MKDSKREAVSFVAPIRPRNLLWIAVLAGAGPMVTLYGTPHLRVRYTYFGKVERPYYETCDYWGIGTFSLRPADGVCPLVVLARAGGKG